MFEEHSVNHSLWQRGIPSHSPSFVALRTVCPLLCLKESLRFCKCDSNAALGFRAVLAAAAQ